MWNVSNRFQAFGIHMSLSLLVFIILAAVIYFSWYPGFLFHYDGGLQGMKLIAGVDFFIGPVLTLCVYKISKKSLKFDLTCIALMQVACLSGGMWTVAKTRPIAIVYAAGSYSTTNDFGYTNNKYSVDQIEILQKRWPVWLAVNLPEDEENAVKGVWSALGEGLQYNVENYIPYVQKVQDLAKSGLPVDDVKDSTLEMKTYQANNPELRFFPMTTSLYEGYVAVDVKNGKVLDFFKSE